MGVAIGIDFGTTVSKIAYRHDGITTAIKNKMCASEFTPSVVGINEHINEIKFGKTAESFTSGVISGIKRILGEQKKLKLGNREFSIEEIAGMFLKYLKEYGEDYLNDEINEAVITVQAGISEEAKNSLLTASQLAGFKEIKLLKEPVAAILASGIDIEASEKKVLVYDFGGGTFNAGIVNTVKKQIQLTAFNSIKDTGGSLFDLRLVDYLKENLINQYGTIEIDETLEHKLYTAAKKAKEQLSNPELTNTKIQFVAIVNSKVILFELFLSREKLNQLIEDLVDETILCTDSLLKSSGTDKSEISRVMLVGGSSRLPIVKEKVAAYFGAQPYQEVDPDLAVCYGAAIQAGMIKSAADSIYWI